MDKNKSATVSVTKGSVQKAIDSCSENGKSTTLVFKVTTAGKADIFSIKWSEAAQKKLLNSNIKEVKMEMDGIQVSISPKVFKKIEKVEGATAVTKIEKIPASMLSETTSKVVNKHFVFKIDITNKKGQSVKKFEKGTVSVSIPYTLRDNEEKDKVCGVYITEKGKIKKVTGSYYDSATGMLIVDVNQTGVYGIRY